MTAELSIDGGIATLTLNRPQARNAVNAEMCEALRAAAVQVAADVTVKLVIVRGAGPVFCAGADLKERAGMLADEVRARRLKAFAAYDALEALPMPSVAVVHGAVIGSGIEIAASCDFIVATPDTVFATPEALRGTVGATQRLPRVLGKRLAKDLMFTGRRLSAQEALAAGLVSRVVDDLENEFQAIAKAVLEAPQETLRQAKHCIDRGTELDPRGALALELAVIEAQLSSGKWMGKA
ncbi:MAG: enoyl-CoA hydratase/isomerase family protein [Betaproteobacteria bacterium]|nr:MAG: enoyl-CoA hydratase/isomerase family protein [Betaproteobacteria bacterium]